VIRSYSIIQTMAICQFMWFMLQSGNKLNLLKYFKFKVKLSNMKGMKGITVQLPVQKGGTKCKLKFGQFHFFGKLAI